MGSVLWDYDFNEYSTGDNALSDGSWSSIGAGASWRYYWDGSSYHVLYENGFTGSPVMLVRPASRNVDISCKLKLSGAPEDALHAVHGVVALCADANNFVAYEAVKHDGSLPGTSGAENKHVIYVRSSGVERTILSKPASFNHDQEYIFRMLVVGKTMTVWVDGVEIGKGEFTDLENTTLTSNRAGVIQYAGFPFWDWVKAETVDGFFYKDEGRVYPLTLGGAKIGGVLKTTTVEIKD